MATHLVRAQPGAMALFSGLVLMLNALNNRVDNRSAELEVLGSLMAERLEPGTQEVFPEAYAGCYNILELINNHGIFEVGTPGLPLYDTIAKTLGFSTWIELTTQVIISNRHALPTPTPLSATATRRNNRIAVRAQTPELPDDSSDNPFADLGDHASGYTPGSRSPLPFTKYLLSLVTRVLREVMAKVPNKRNGNGSYLVPTVDLGNIDLDFFMDADVGALFQITFTDYWAPEPSDNFKPCLERIFPGLGPDLVKNGWTQLGSRTEWRALLANSSPADAARIRDSVIDVCCTFTWIPFNANDKVWKTCPKQRGGRGFPNGPMLLVQHPDDFNGIENFVDA